MFKCRKLCLRERYRYNIQVLYLHLAWQNYGSDVLNITMHIEVVIHSLNAYVWCWRKLCGSLDENKFHLLQWEVVKEKFLINSNTTLTVLNLHQKTDPKVQQDFKGQGHYDKVKSRLHHDAAHLHP